MTLWAIRWGPYSTRPSSEGWVDYRTIARTRSEAWARFKGTISPGATPLRRAKIKRDRRNGEIRAVRVEVKEVS